MRQTMLRLAIVIAAAVPVSSIALAADPESGTVGPSSPKVSWTGTLTVPYAVWLPWFQNDGEGECTDPHCDSFALTVAGGPADLTVEMSATSVDPSQEAIRVVKPDGSIVYFNNTEVGTEPTKLVIKGAANGEYAVDVATGSKTEAEYEASATLAVPPPAAGGGPTATPTPGGPGATPTPSGGGGPAPAPGQPAPGQPAPQPGAAQDFTLTVKAPSVRARKARKGARVKVGVRVSREVQSVTATLRQGRRKVGAGKLGRVAAAGNLPLRLSRKLKPGRYTLTVAARDARGVVVSKTVRLRVRR